MIGVMQGRLLPKYQGRYQAHPVGYWQDEFPIARDAGLDCIEFILDYEGALENPLICPGGPDEILRVSEQTGVAVRTVCADYFMEAPLHSADRDTRTLGVDVLRRLLASGQRLGVTDVVLPCVDKSSLGATDEALERLIATLRPVLDELERLAINLSLETDLSPRRFQQLLNRFDSRRITVNYDTGNSASLGYDPIEELDAYGLRISDVHIKDRVRGGGSVLLGTGNARFGDFFAKLAEFDYQGPFIMQAYRDDEGRRIFEQQLEWMRPYLRPYS